MMFVLWVLWIPIIIYFLLLVQLFKNFQQHLDPVAAVKQAQQDKEFMLRRRNPASGMIWRSVMWLIIMMTMPIIMMPVMR